MATNVGGFFANAQRMPGLLGSPVQRLAQRASTGLGQLFGGQDDPRLTAEQNEAARRQAIMQAGLATLAASQESGASGLGSIAQGAMYGQQAGAQGREMAYARTAEDRIQQALQDPNVVGKLTPQQLAMVRLMPPQDAARLLSQLAFAPAPEAKVVSDGGALVGPDGRVIYENANGGAALPADLRAALFEMGLSPDTMTPEQRAAALARYMEIKRSGATQVNVGGQQDFQNQQSLSTSFERDVAVYQDVANSYATVRAAATNPSPAGDLSLVFAYMKMLDPGSTVREGEQAMARNAANIPERVRAQYNRLLGGGESLAPEQRADFLNQAKKLADQKQTQIKPVLSRYERRARGIGMDPSLVIYNPFEELDATGGAAAGGGYDDLIPTGGR